MSQTNSSKSLIIAIVLILLACIRFEYRTAQWELTLPGLFGGIIILTIVGLVLLYRTFYNAQDACLKLGLIESRVKSQYDLLFPVAVFAVAIHGVWRGDPVQGVGGDEVYQWEFAWSDPDYNIPFLAALAVVVLLLRIRALFGAIEAHARGK